jgi:alkaline phosphatase D
MARIVTIAIALLVGACAGPQPSLPTGADQGAITPALTEPFAYGVASGDMTGESAVLWTRTPGPATVIPELSLTPGFERTRTLPSAISAESSDFTVKVLATALEPGVRYYYRFRAGRDVSPTGSFRTAYAPDQSAVVRLAFTGDADWRWRPFPILAAVAQENVDYFLFLGDLIYEFMDQQGKTVADDLQGYRFKYRENREPPPNVASGMLPMRDLYAAFGQYSVFDNHETGYSPDPKAPRYNEGGAPFAGGFVNKTPGYKARIQAYKEYQPVQEEIHSVVGDALTDGTDRFYRAYRWGANVELIVLDDRSYRSIRLKSPLDPDAASCDRTMLGRRQLEWFENALLAAKRGNAVWKLVVISSPIQELGNDAQIGFDMEGTKSWAGTYRCERNRILKFIDDNAIDNVVFLTTDNHFTAINNLSYEAMPGDSRSQRKPARNAFEIMTGPLGAVTGTLPYIRAAVRKGAAQGHGTREADRRILSAWNGDSSDADGKLMGLAQAGLDRIGLEPDFPGLDVASIRTAGGQAGVAEPLAFASFNSFSYAVLTLDQSRMLVQVKTMPSVVDPSTLLKADALREYERQRPQETLNFSVRAR